MRVGLTARSARQQLLPWIMTSWRRNTFTTSAIGSGFNWEDAIAEGNTYQRVHLRWGFHLDTPITTDISAIAQNLVSLGVCTTIGDGSESRPNARSGAWPNEDPPTERWIYWETRAPIVRAIDYQAGIITWTDSGATEPTQTKGQVLAQGIPGGDSLNLSTSWAAAEAFDTSINTALWVSVSIMRKD